MTGTRMYFGDQLGTEFCDSNYDDIKKVYRYGCVWVPDYIGNAISEYRMEKRDVVPGFPDDRASYDKLSVVVIGLKRK